ncbi:cysteine sulfinic acid decarboxylase [Nylanderia fulva]|uniref:cysteine sulfinic acid decarboxylase n=1 Tax=Nylanderia fulva TaxID=613905 RepID=UPI0010FB3747|nr:cysteine sulfinic acid decarboxylase [Nylanderia fulva]
MPANKDDTFSLSLARKTNPPPTGSSRSKIKLETNESSSTIPILPNSFAPSTDEACKGFRKGDFRSMPFRNVHEKLFRDFFELVLQRAVFQSTSGEERVVEWVDPKDLRSVVNLSLPTEGVDHKELLTLTRDIIKYSVKTGHPHFVNQLFSSLDPYGLLGQWLTDALNPSVYTYEVSPVFSLMEEDVLREMRAIIGWQSGEGLFCPGGSMANGYAINLARHHRYPNLKQTGLSQMPRLVVFTSEDAHYSVKKLAAFLGIGYDNVYQVKVDSRGKMMVTDLEIQIARAVEEGAVPLMVSATAGTTVIGAFDPLREIAEVCRKRELWFHVDAAWGGGALVSRTYRRLLDGVHLADSVTWNPHKLLAAPQQCSTLLLRHEGLLQAAHGCGASYLFQNDKFYNAVFDGGDRHVQCGRRADVVKFWYMWKAKGTRGLEAHVDRVFALSRYFTDLIRTREGWRLLAEPECTNVCFRYIPPSKRHLTGPELDQTLHKIASMIKERMVRAGTMLITYQTLRDMPNFFRLVLQNSGLMEADMKFFVEEIERLAVDL